MVAVGKAYDCVEIRHGGRSAGFGFHFTPDGGYGPLVIETTIIIPGWGTPEVFNGRTLRVVYLQSIKRTLKNEAIDLDILSGRDAGFHDSIDARPFGSWLLIPIGGAFATFGYFGIRYRKDDKDAATTS